MICEHCCDTDSEQHKQCKGETWCDCQHRVGVLHAIDLTPPFVVSKEFHEETLKVNKWLIPEYKKIIEMHQAAQPLSPSTQEVEPVGRSFKSALRRLRVLKESSETLSRINSESSEDQKTNKSETQ